MTIWFALLKFVNKHKPLVIDAVLVVVAVIAVALALEKLHRVFHPVPPAAVVTTVPALPPGVKVITVDRPVLTEKVVTKTITDPQQAALIKALLAENAKLKAGATTATVATVESVSHGGGALTAPASKAGTDPATLRAATVGPVHFTDYRLDFTSDGKNADYTLRQKFVVVATTGRRVDGSPLALAKLYELGPKQNMTELKTIETTTLVADQTTPHWMRGLGIQAGVAVSRDALGSTAASGVVALQWLSKGRTKAAEDTSCTILAPAAVIGNGVQDFGLVPFAVNFGRLPHQPFSNVWAGVFVAKSQRVGVTLTAKF